MRKLNLTDPEGSQIKYTVSNFPDGQQSITIDNYEYGDSDWIQIQSRFNSFKDLELIICATQALREMGLNKIHLYVPYFLGARSDRKFGKGGFNYIKSVVAPIINLQKYESVTCIDPHSDVLEACINNFKKINNVELVNFALFHIHGSTSAWKKDYPFTLVSPDAGALKKVYEVAEAIGYTKDIIIASKHRDLKTGAITHTEVPVHSQHANQKFVIVDDICDGGRTFIEISKVIRRHFADAEIYLVVTHGIFSKGTETLKIDFDGIFCTDSYQSIESNDPFVKQLKVYGK